MSALAGIPRELLSAIFDAYPSPTYLVDADLRIGLMNRAALELAHREGLALPRLSRGGEALHCLGSEPGGCGKGAGCGGCVIRGTVTEAFARGALYRARAFMQRRDGDRSTEVVYLVSVSPMTHDDRALAVLTLEDVTVVARLKSLLPMCAGCRKIRNDEDYWQSVEAYLKDQLDVDVSHGFCEDCVERLYPGLVRLPRRPR